MGKSQGVKVRGVLVIKGLPEVSLIELRKRKCKITPRKRQDRRVQKSKSKCL